jgi:nucleoid-associated protein YgaU
MANERQIRGTIAILGAAAAAVVAVLLGVLYWDRTAGPSTSQSASQVAGEPIKASGPQPQAPSAQAASAEPKSAEPKSAEPKPAAPGEAPKAADAPIAPSFDVVRIEPDGESVIAGRAAPGAMIELLRGDQVHARAAADASGLFALVPPPLPPGSHQMILQSTAPDGTRQRSRESVTVVLNAAKTRPLVALTAPDKPTVLLSNPEPPEAKAPQENAALQEPKPAQGTKPAEPPAQAAPQQQASAAPGSAPPAPTQETPPQAAPRPEIKIMSVDSEEGRLFVSGQTAPGATVRLYLNESFIAPGGSGSDGRVSFSIGSGVKPGDYRVRLDDVDPVSGQVKSRAEVAFNVPAASVPVAAAPPQLPAPESSSPASPGAGAPLAGGKTASAAPEPDINVGTVVIPNINTAIVSRGDNLWRISQRTYGRGLRYTVIYGANQEQIRNPNLIYPGQVFVLPAEQAQKAN